MGQRASKVTLLFCAFAIVGTAYWGIRNGYFIVSAIVLAEILWELKSQNRQLQTKTRTLLSLLISLFAVILNLGIVHTMRGRIGVITALVVGGVILAFGDLRFGKNSASQEP